MIAIRFGILMLFAALATAQQAAVASRAQAIRAEPGLPVVDYNACPFEGCVFRDWTVNRHSTLYDTWQKGRKAVGHLSVGEKVQGLTGVYITRKPDRFVVKQAIPYLSLKTGDVILQYAEWGEGYADLWANGVWYKDFDWSQVDDGQAITLADGGFTSPLVFRDDNVTLVRHGIKEWWVQVRSVGGKTGRVLAQGNFDHMDRFGEDPRVP